MIETPITMSFGDFPDDVQLCVLSFLSPSELAAFACTCKRFDALHRHDQRLWFSLCHRRWGSKTVINKWGGGNISYKRLYHVLDTYDRLIGFWRRCSGEASASAPPLVLFEWGTFYITGSRVSPSKNSGYGVIKKPFFWLTIAPNGETMSYLDPDGRASLTEKDLMGESVVEESELIRANLSFFGDCHVVLEENLGLNSSRRCSSLRDEVCDESVCGSSPDRMMMEIYQYFANITIPGGNGSPRRQRRRDKEKQGRMKKWETEHFVKVVNCSPKPSRPLQGLWKAICDDMTLEFYLMTYDDVGGIACRRIGDPNRPPTYHAPIFWTSNLAFVESPFSAEEDDIYNSRLHLRPPAEADPSSDNVSSSDDDGAVSRMLHINSSYDLIIADLVGTTINHRRVEGRIWQYWNGTFGFGFLRDNYIIDMKHIAIDGHILDTVEPNVG